MKNPFSTPIITGPLDTPANKVKTSKALVATIQASPDYVVGSELDTACIDFLGETNKLDTSNQNVVKADLAADQARNDQSGSLARWGTRKRNLLNAARITTDGSALKMQNLGFGVLDPQTTPLGVVPTGLYRKGSKHPGVATVAWPVQPGVSTFMVQHATDPNDATTLSTPRSSSKASFSLSGLVPGATVYFRVYAMDPRLPSGQTDWSAWFAVKASV